MLLLIYGFVLFASQSWFVSANPARYDQRQTGDVNVQIDLKDVKILALLKSDILDDYMNYDYVYDYADFTLKPVTKPTTKSPLTTSSSSKSSTPSTVSTTEMQTTENVIVTTSEAVVNEEPILKLSTKPSEIITENTSTAASENGDDLSEKITNTSEKALHTPTDNSSQNKKIAKRCKGLDKTGRCFRRRISILPLAMRVAPELLQSVRRRITA